jgi:hypothetical protein
MKTRLMKTGADICFGVIALESLPSGHCVAVIAELSSFTAPPSQVCTTRACPAKIVRARSAVYFAGIVVARNSARRVARKLKYSSIPAPVLAESFMTCIPGRTAWMFP